jgi:hypothetical protein
VTAQTRNPRVHTRARRPHIGAQAIQIQTLLLKNTAYGAQQPP